MTVTCSPLFRKRRVCEASDCGGCSTGGVWPLLWYPSACGVCQRLRGLRQSAAECRRVLSRSRADKHVRTWRGGFLTTGAKVNATRLHETPLHHAAKNMRVEMIEILVEFGANVYARDQHNRKPVDYTTPGSPSAGFLSFYESECLCSARLLYCSISTLPEVGSTSTMKAGSCTSSSTSVMGDYLAWRATLGCRSWWTGGQVVQETNPQDEENPAGWTEKLVWGGL